MKRLILFPLVLSAFCARAQERTEAAPAPEFRRLQLGINLSPDITFRTLRNDDGAPLYDALMEQRNDTEIPQFGYTAGLNLCYNITRSLAVETGLHHAKRGYRTKALDVIAFDPLSQNDPFIPNSIRYIAHWYYMDIPLRVDLALGKKKLRVLLSAGVTTNILLSATQTNVLEFADRTERATDTSVFDHNAFNISPTLSVGLDYRIAERLNLRAEPTFRYGAMRIIDTPITGFLYSGGLNIGVYYGL